MFADSARVYDLLLEAAGKDYFAESAAVHHLIQRHRPGAETLLDVGCGTGQHLLRLSRWYRCWGLDVAPAMVDIARERIPAAEIVVGDMRGFEFGRTFDAVVCLFNVIGYMTTVGDLHQAVAVMAGHLAPAGVLVVEAWYEPDAWATPTVTTEVVETDAMTVVRMNSSQRDGRLATMDYHYLVGTPDGVEHFAEPHVTGLFTGAEYEAAFTAAGLAVTRDPDALSGRGVYLGVRDVP